MKTVLKHNDSLYIKFDSLFSNKDSLEVFYEDFLEDFESQLNRVQNVLGVEPQPLKPSTVRQSVEPLANIVENFDEVSTAMEDTPWKSTLDCSFF